MSDADIREIVVEHVNPPIPIRWFDWRATLAGYEPGDAQGWGSTEAGAKADLIRTLQEEA